VSIEFLAEIWVPELSHKIDNKFFIHHYQGWKEGWFVWNCLIFFVGEYSFVWPEICRVLTQIQKRFWRGISGKNYFGRIFQKFCPLPKLSSTTNLWNFYLVSEIFFWLRIVVKKITQVLSYVFCTQVKRHIHKQITKIRYRDVLFSENQFCWLSVLDLLRLTPWVFCSKIFSRRSSLCLLSFG